MKILFSLIVLICGIASAETTQPSQARQSFDGVVYPDITATPSDAALPKGYTRLSDVQQLLLHDPASIGLKVFNSQKSADILSHRTTYFIPIDSSTSHQRTLGMESITIHGERKIVGSVETAWFAINMGNADLAGIDLRGGVISKLVLFYKSSTAAQNDLQHSYPDGFQNSGWKIIEDGEDGQAVLLEAKASVAAPVDGQLAKRYRAIIDSKLAQTDMPSLDKVPLVGDETSLVLVKANPQKYVDVPFIICGVTSLKDYFNFGYGDAKPTHYSFGFNALTASGEHGESATLYALKSMGDDLINVLSHLNQLSPNAELLMRFKVTVSSEYVKTYDDAEQMFEVLDWQFYDFNAHKWGPWYSQVIGGDAPVDANGGDLFEHVGPRGGVYHVDANGNKVYQKH